MSTLELRSLTKRFGDFTAVDGISLSARDGEMIALLGGSGCGKTTTLRMIAGFLEPDGGEILVDGTEVSRVPAYKRNIGIFFQNYALFPHLTVFENVAFGLRLKHLPKQEIRGKVREMLDLVKLYGLDERYPRELSGGQQQRVALARALVMRPQILLLDEPLSNLDAKLRVEMQVEIKRIQRKLGITTIIVTHDHEEAVSLADRVIVMHEGELLQVGAPEEVFERPVSPFVADFMGFSTFLEGTAGLPDGNGLRRVECSGRELSVREELMEGIEPGTACTVAVRSEALSLAESSDPNSFEGSVCAYTYKGNTTRLEVGGCFAEPVFVAKEGYLVCEEGERVCVRFPTDRICVYKKQ